MSWSTLDSSVMLLELFLVISASKVAWYSFSTSAIWVSILSMNLSTQQTLSLMAQQDSRLLQISLGSFPSPQEIFLISTTAVAQSTIFWTLTFLFLSSLMCTMMSLTCRKVLPIVPVMSWWQCINSLIDYNLGRWLSSMSRSVMSSAIRVGLRMLLVLRQSTNFPRARFRYSGVINQLQSTQIIGSWMLRQPAPQSRGGPLRKQKTHLEERDNRSQAIHSNKPAQTKSLMCSPEQRKKNRQIIQLDVALLRKDAKVHNLLSPRSLNNPQELFNRQTTASTPRSLEKTYSLGKIKGEAKSKRESITTPFTEEEDHSKFMKAFLQNKLKHQKNLQHIRQALSQAIQGEFRQVHDESCIKDNESLFSFEIYAKNPNTLSEEDSPATIPPPAQGAFYLRMRSIIDSRQA